MIDKYSLEILNTATISVESYKIIINTLFLLGKDKKANYFKEHYDKKIAKSSRVLAPKSYKKELKKAFLDIPKDKPFSIKCDTTFYTIRPQEFY